jgi:hypothetical protein
MKTLFSFSSTGQGLDLDGRLDSLALLLLAIVGLGTHDTTTPVTTVLLVLVRVTLLDGGDELGELGVVLRADLGQSNDGGSLLVDDCSETSLALDDGVRNTHLAAESGEEDNQLNGVDVVSNKDERSLLVLNETNNVVETVLDSVGLLGDILLLLALSDSGGLLVETLLLLSLGLGAVLVEELEGLSSGVAVEGVGELGDRRRDLETQVQDLLLALKTDIFGPLDEAGEVALGLDILTNTEVAVASLEEGVLGLLGTSLTLGEGGGSNFLSFRRLSLRKEESANRVQHAVIFFEL